MEKRPVSRLLAITPEDFRQTKQTSGCRKYTKDRQKNSHRKMSKLNGNIIAGFVGTQEIIEGLLRFTGTEHMILNIEHMAGGGKNYHTSFVKRMRMPEFRPILEKGADKRAGILKMV